MKYFLVVLALLGLASTASSEVITSPVYTGGCTNSTVYVTSFTATRASQMDPGDLDTSTGTLNTQNPTSLMADRKMIKISNNDRAGQMYRCDFSSTTVGPSMTLGGDIVASSATITYQIPSADGAGNRFKVWCRSSGALVSTATVTQCK